ncbi:hypothetical protein D3C76_1111910 [compost metagenome]
MADQYFSTNSGDGNIEDVGSRLISGGVDQVGYFMSVKNFKDCCSALGGSIPRFTMVLELYAARSSTEASDKLCR